MKYFAYGSNMSLARLKGRVPSAKRLGMFCLRNHQLAFHKISKKDGSAKCDAFFTDNAEHCIFGALYEIDDSEKEALDRVEGLGYGYDEKTVQVEDVDSNIFNAATYIATPSSIDSDLMPYTWYLYHVEVGARETGVPKGYLDDIMNTTANEDPEKERDKSEREIYAE